MDYFEHYTCYLCGPHIMDSRRLLRYSNKASGIANYTNLLVFYECHEVC